MERPETQVGRKLITVQEASRLTRRHHHTLRGWVKAGKITGVRDNYRLYLYEDELVAHGLVRTRRGRNAKKDSYQGVVVTPEQVEWLPPTSPLIPGALLGVEEPTTLGRDFQNLRKQVHRLRDTVAMLLDELGYGSDAIGMSPQQLNLLVHRAGTDLRLGTRPVGVRNGWAETVMKLQDEDIRWLAVARKDWQLVYQLLLAMRQETTGVDQTSKILRAKLDRAMGHLQRLVWVVSQTSDRGSRLQERAEQASVELGLTQEPTTQRLLVWLDRVLSA